MIDRRTIEVQAGITLHAVDDIGASYNHSCGMGLLCPRCIIRRAAGCEAASVIGSTDYSRPASKSLRETVNTILGMTDGRDRTN